MYNRENTVEMMRKRYPAGTRIVLEKMGEDPRPVKPGTKGTVVCVDDIGTAHCIFDNGRQLGLIPDEDIFYIMPDGMEKEKTV